MGREGENAIVGILIRNPVGVNFYHSYKFVGTWAAVGDRSKRDQTEAWVEAFLLFSILWQANIFVKTSNGATG
jgi:uncharacterized membrane-anchored protein